MKLLNKTGGVLRTIGIVLVCIALVLGLYNLATSNTNWKTMSMELKADGVSTGLITRLKFDKAIFAAMSETAGMQDATMAERTSVAETYFAGFTAAVEKAKPQAEQAKIDEIYAYFQNEFDAEGYAEQYEKWEENQENREISAVISELDALSVPAGKSSKKLAALITSCEDYMASFYAELSAEGGEEAVGSYLEFLLTAQALISDAAEAGETITGAEAWMTANFDKEAYLEKLAAVQYAERVSETGMLSDFAALMEEKAAGNQVDFPAFFEGVYAEMNQQAPEEAAPTYLAYLTALRAKIDSGITFDGAYSTIRAAAKTTQETLNSASFASFLTTFSRTVVTEADGSNQVFIMLWMLCSIMLPILFAGIVLIIAGVVVKKIVYAVLLRRMEKEDQAKEHSADEPEDDVLLRVSGLKQYFRNGNFVTKAVDDVNFYIKKGEVFGLVGESGCGKTTTGRTIINLYDPTEGDVYFQGLRISSSMNGLPVLMQNLKNEAAQKIEAIKKSVKEGKLSKQEANQQIKAIRSELRAECEAARDAALESSVEKSMCVRKYRQKRQQELTAEYEKDCQGLTGEELEKRTNRYQVEMKVAAKDNIMTRMQMIFQDPIASINPRMTVREIIAEGLTIRGVKDKKYIEEKVYEMLDLVGLVREHADRYPHEFSGGQRQRIGIARAIVMQPDLIIADEPISALDVSIQAQVINLLNDLRSKMGLTLLFIAHNLSVVKYFSDRIAVMYFGKIVELADSDELFEHPLHPYTKSLLSAIPYPDPHFEKNRRRITYKPNEVHDYSVDKPSMKEIKPGHFIYCNEAELAAYKEELGL